MDAILRRINLITAVEMQKRNYPLPEFLKKALEESTIEERCEVEIDFVEAEYELEMMKGGRNNG